VKEKWNEQECLHGGAGFHYSLMDGTLATLPDKTIVRRIKVKKDK